MRAALESLIDSLPWPGVTELSGYLEAFQNWLSSDSFELCITVAADRKAEYSLRSTALENARAIASISGDSIFIAVSASATFEFYADKARSDTDLPAELITSLRGGLAAARSVGAVDVLCTITVQLASLLCDVDLPDERGRLMEASQLFEQAIELCQRLGNDDELAAAQSNYSLTLIRLGRMVDDVHPHPESMRLVQAALNYRQDLSPGSRDVAYSLGHRAMVYLDLGHITEDTSSLRLAVADLTAALNIARSVGDRALAVAMELDLAEACSSLAKHGDVGGLDAAIQHYAAVGNDETNPPGQRFRAFKGLVDALQKGDSPPQEIGEALAHAAGLAHAIGLAEHCELAYSAGKLLAQADSWALAADLFEQAHDASAELRDHRRSTVDSDEPIGESLDEYEQAVRDGICHLRGLVGARDHADFPLTAWDSFQNAARWSAFCHARAGSLKRAVEILEAGRCEYLARSTRERVQTLDGILDQHLVQEYVNARDEAHRGPIGFADPRTRNRLEAAIRAIRQAGYSDFLRRRRLSEIASDFSFDHPLVYLLTTPWGSLCLVVTSSEDVQDLSLPELNSNTVATWLFGFDWDNNAPSGTPLLGSEGRAHAKALDRVLANLGTSLMLPLSRLLQHCGAERVTLVPTWHLMWMPLHAATYTVDGNTECLIDLMPVEYLPAAIYRIAKAEQDIRKAQRRMLVGLADPSGSRPSLPSARTEAAAALQWYEGDAHVVFGRSVTTSFLLDQMESPIDLHIACHASSDSTGLAASLHLSDGDISLAELSRLPKRMPLGLVVAAACDSGHYELTSSPEEGLSLSIGFLNSGATGVITSRWPVDDEASALVMSRFYELTQIHQLDPAEAIRAASLWLRDSARADLRAEFRKLRDRVRRNSRQLSRAAEPASRGPLFGNLRRPYRHPYYWAGWIYTGSTQNRGE